MWSIFENVPCAFESNAYFASLRWKFLCISVKYIWSWALPQCHNFLADILLGRSVHCWQSGVKIPYFNCVAVCIFLQVLRDFYYIFWCFYVRCMYVSNVYVLVGFFPWVLWSILLSLFLWPSFEVSFVWYKYCCPSFFPCPLAWNFFFILSLSVFVSLLFWGGYLLGSICSGHVFLYIWLPYDFWLEHFIHFHWRLLFIDTCSLPHLPLYTWNTGIFEVSLFLVYTVVLKLKLSWRYLT